MDVHLQAVGVRIVIRRFAGDKLHRSIAARESFRKPRGNTDIALAGAQPAGNVFLIPVSQQIRSQYLPQIGVRLFRISHEKLGDGAVADVVLQ